MIFLFFRAYCVAFKARDAANSANGGRKLVADGAERAANHPPAQHSHYASPGNTTTLSQFSMSSQIAFGSANSGLQVAQNFAPITAEFRLPPGKLTKILGLLTLTTALRTTRNPSKPITHHSVPSRQRFYRARRTSR